MHTPSRRVMHIWPENLIGGMPNHVPEKSVLRSETIRDAGKLPSAAQAPVSAMPFKEHHLKQLRAQCLVFLAFRNGLIPKKPHLEIALGNVYPKEDRRELVDHKGREQLVTDQGCASEVTRTVGGAGETDRLFSGPTPSGVLAETNSSMEAENTNLMEDNGQLDPTGHADERRPQRKMRMIQDAEVPIQDATESQASALRVVPTDSKSLPPYNHEHAPANTEQFGMFPQVSSFMGTSKQMTVNTHVSGPLMKDNQNLVDSNAPGNRHADSNLPSLPLRQQWKSVPGVTNQSPATMQVKDSNIMLKNLSQVQETDQEDENISASTDRLSSPRHTMMEKWILDRQKRKRISEQKWSEKQHKTEERIAACAEKLKGVTGWSMKCVDEVSGSNSSGGENTR
ncbi:hypothetical protein BC332_28495 [Capsicum chinense]|nr:hypothetical protein BC332_28495 [Capsicum chinense]